MDLDLRASESLAFGAGAVHAAVALVFWHGRRYRPAWGLHWLAWAFAGASAINLMVSTQHWSAPAPGTAAYVAVAVLGTGVTSALVVGVLQFVGLGARRPVRAALMVAAAFVAGAALCRVLGFGDFSGSVAVSCLFLGLTLACAHAARAEAAAGTWALVPALMAYPAMVAATAAAGLDALALRLWGAVPFALVGLSLMVVALWRYHHELQAELARRERAEAELRQLNLSLEQRIEERTGELRDMVGGLESFNRMVSHDLRGPLGGLSGLSALAGQALEAGDTPRAVRMMGMISGETQRLVELVNDLLTLARISHAELELRDTPLDAVLDEAMQALSLSQDPAAMQCIVRDPLPPVRADGRLLRQVFVNLIANALKFSARSPGAEVRVQGDSGNSQVVVEVRDNGVGFAPEQAAELFQPFMRLHGQQFDGTGVGLTIVRRIVERHGGRVWAEGRPGQGASFFFSLPAA